MYLTSENWNVVDWLNAYRGGICEKSGNLFNLHSQLNKIRDVMSIEKKPVEKTALDPQSIEGEADSLRRDIYRPDMEKLKLFTQMLRTNALFKKAKVTHK